MSNFPREDVLVVPRALFDRVGAFQGFCADTAAYLPALLDPRHDQHVFAWEVAHDGSG